MNDTDIIKGMHLEIVLDSKQCYLDPDPLSTWQQWLQVAIGIISMCYRQSKFKEFSRVTFYTPEAVNS